MHPFLCLLLLLCGCTHVCATTDASSHPSPDGQFAIYNIGDTAEDNHYFEVRTKEGAVVYSSQNSAELELPTHASAIRWTPDSKFVLLWVQQGKFDSTCIFSTEDRTLIHLALGEEDSYTVPVRWAGQHTFVVEISGPHGHRAQMNMWHYRKTYRVTAHPFRLKCIATSRTVHNDEVFFPAAPLLYITAPNHALQRTAHGGHVFSALHILRRHEPSLSLEALGSSALTSNAGRRQHTPKLPMASDHLSPQRVLPRPTKSRAWLMAASIYLLYVLLCLAFEGYARHHVNELRLQRIALAQQQHSPVIFMPNTKGDLEQWTLYSLYSTLIGILTLLGAFALAVVCFLKLSGTGTTRPPTVYRFRGFAYVLIVPFFVGGFLVMAPRLFADTVCRFVESMTGSHFFFF